jgi:TRAP-type C4-dicarboxylate transport system substrate-binding protein
MRLPALFAGLLVASLLVAPHRPAHAADAPVPLRFSTAAPPSDFLSQALVAFRDDVNKAAPGQFDISLHPASTLFRQGTEFPALQRGNLEMSTGTTFEVAAQMAEWGFFNRAYLIRDYAQLRRIFDGPIGAEYRKQVADRMGIEILAVGYLGTRQLNLRTKREVHGPADLAGVKTRMPADPEWLLLGQSIGVQPVPLGMPEVYLALKTGTIDAQENPLTILNAAKFYEVTQQVVLTAHLVQPVFFDIALPVWQKLTDAQRAVLQAAATSALKGNDDARLADEAKVLDELKAKGLTITQVDLTPFHKRADEVYAGSAVAKKWDQAMMQRAAAQ